MIEGHDVMVRDYRPRGRPSHKEVSSCVSCRQSDSEAAIAGSRGYQLVQRIWVRQDQSMVDLVEKEDSVNGSSFGSFRSRTNE